MKIKKNSWHYRLLSYFPWKIYRWSSYSICQYFWLIVWTFIFCLVVVPIAVTGVLIVATSVAALILYPILQFFFGTNEVAAVFSALIDTALLIWLWVLYREKYVTKPFCSEKVVKKMNLLGEYIEAKHRKVCPLIDFED